MKRKAFETAMDLLRDAQRKYRNAHEKAKTKEEGKAGEGEDTAAKDGESKPGNNEVSEETKKSLEKEMIE